MKTCIHCSAQFEVTVQDQGFYAKINVPEPTHCPQCRMQRRMAFRNEQNLYKRTCDLTGKEIISNYSPDKPFTVYNYQDWNEDEWDPLEYGREFDFTRPFFEQFAELLQVMPKKSLSIRDDMENCDYCNYGAAAKDCYLCFCPYEAQNCLYSWTPVRSAEDVDGYANAYCQHCYECVYGMNCYELQYCDYCTGCSNSAFLLDCVSCKDCFGCVNLHQKQYYFLNERYSKEEYAKKVQEILGSHENIRKFARKFAEFSSQFPRRCNHNQQNENCSGDMIQQSKDCYQCFDVMSLENGAYCCMGGEAHELYDCNIAGVQAAQCYESIGILSCNQTFFNAHASGNVNCMYCLISSNCQNCFGCDGLKHKKYCIFNKQYSKKEYEKILPKIIKHMQKTKEWGEFFPISLSPFAYNESVAQEYFPLTKEEVLKNGWQWKEEELEDFSGVSKKIPAEKLPDVIADVPDDVLNWAIICEESKKPFKIVKSELEFYRKMNIPLPHLHPDVRYQKRLQKKNPYKLWNRECAKCQKKIQTSYAPERPEVVYCEECYLTVVY